MIDTNVAPDTIRNATMTTSDIRVPNTERKPGFAWRRLCLRTTNSATMLGTAIRKTSASACTPVSPARSAIFIMSSCKDSLSAALSTASRSTPASASIVNCAITLTKKPTLYNIEATKHMSTM